MKALVVGLGSAGRRHLRNLHAAGVRDLMALRSSATPVEEVSRFGVVEYRDLEQALDRKPDVVFVTNPTALHMAIALSAAERGCDLFIEKPLSHSVDGVDALIDMVRAKRLVAMVGCNFRFHPGLAKVREYIRNETLGRVVTVRAHAGEYLPGWHPGEDYRAGYSARKDLGGGVILTVIHELDYLCWMFGDVSRVCAMSGAWSSLGLDVEDAAEILVQFVGGARASIHLDYVQRPRARTLEVIAEGGTIRWDFYGGRLSIFDASIGSWVESESPGFDQRNAMYEDELRHFLECVAERREPSIPLQEGRRVLEAALAARESGATGTVITLPSGKHAVSA